MKLRELTLGPIVGETTPQRTRIWGRGDAHIIEDAPRRCFGAIRYRKSGTKQWQKHQIIKMNPNFDLTGVAILDGLESETRYDNQFGYFFSDAEMGDADFSESDWSDAGISNFLTASKNDRKPRTLVIGSCRYLLKTFLGSFFDDRGDKTFRSILEQIGAGQEIHQLIMMGDQIYADDLNASMSLELKSPSNLKIISVISSAFFWPYPHPSARHFKTKGTIDGGKAGIFRLSNASKVISDDNFTRVNIDLKGIAVEIFERKGRRRLHKEHRF